MSEESFNVELTGGSRDGLVLNIPISNLSKVPISYIRINGDRYELLRLNAKTKLHVYEYVQDVK